MCRANSCRVFFFDVLLPSTRLGLLIWNVYDLFQKGNPNWAGATIAAILLPGVDFRPHLSISNKKQYHIFA